MVKVKSAQLQRFRTIWKMFGDGIHPPIPTDFGNLSNDDVWIRVVLQVVVVGRAEPARHLKDLKIRRRLAWSGLCRMNDKEAAKVISGVLRDIGARYAGRDWRTCKKTSALIKNRNYLRTHPGGPRGFLRDAATLKGSSFERVSFIAERLSYIKQKGARDFLTTGFGLIEDRIALDSRVLGALRHLGLAFPATVASQKALYRELEADLILQICKPLGISGAQLDQLLFRHYKEIKRMEAGSR